MPNINEIFSGKFLKADDLRGQTVRVTIQSAEIVEFEDGKKIVVTFVGKDKGLVCNKTNAHILAENIGSPDTDQWAGHTVQLKAQKVEFQGKLVPAIRVVIEDKPAPKLASAPLAASAESDDVPF